MEHVEVLVRLLSQGGLGLHLRGGAAFLEELQAARPTFSGGGFSLAFEQNQPKMVLMS